VKRREAISMTITIDLKESVLAGLQQQAQQQRVTVEALAARILETAAEETATESLEKLVARIKAMPPDPAMTRPGDGKLAEKLMSAPDDPDFNLEEWNRNWAAVEQEMSAITRADDIAEGR